MWRQILNYIPVNLANLIVSFGTISILTRLFDGAEFGRYALTITTMYFVHMALFTWVEAAMARFHAKAEQNGYLPSHLKTIYVASASLIAVCLPILLLLIFILPLEGRLKMLLSFAFVTTCVHLMYNIGVEAHKASHRIGRFSVIHTSQSLLGFGIGIIVVLLTPLRELGPFIGLLIAALVTLAVDLPFMLRKMRHGRVSNKMVGNYFSYGMPICFALILSYMLAQGDLFFIKYFMGDAAVGEYNAGYNLANRSLDVVFVWLGMAFTPIAVTTLERHGLEKTKSVLKAYGETLLLLVMPAAVGIGLVSESAGFILGDSVRANAVKIMPLIAVAAVMNGFIAHYIQRAFVLAKNTRALAITMVLPVILNFGLNIILIPKFGLMGAVWATLIAYGFAIIATFIVARRSFPLPLPLKVFAQTSLACMLMAVVVKEFPIPNETADVFVLLIKATVGGCVYIPTIVLLNVSNTKDIIGVEIAKISKRYEARKA